MNTKIYTPAINVLGETKAKKYIDAGNKSLKENWENKERDSVDPKCILVYGVKDGQVYGGCIQEDFNDYIELAKLKREIEKDNPKNNDNNPFMPIFGLPRAIELDLTFRGYPMEEMKAHGDYRELYHMLDTELKAFKWTNRFLSLNK